MVEVGSSDLQTTTAKDLPDAFIFLFHLLLCPFSYTMEQTLPKDQREAYNSFLAELSNKVVFEQGVLLVKGCQTYYKAVEAHAQGIKNRKMELNEKNRMLTDLWKQAIAMLKYYNAQARQNKGIAKKGHSEREKPDEQKGKHQAVCKEGERKYNTLTQNEDEALKRFREFQANFAPK